MLKEIPENAIKVDYSYTGTRSFSNAQYSKILICMKADKCNMQEAIEKIIYPDVPKESIKRGAK